MLIDRRHYSPVRCGWLLPLCAVVLAGAVQIHNYVAAIQTSTVESSTSVTDAQRMPGSAAAPLWGVDGKGVAYVIERNPPWPLTEFKIIFTNERR